MTNWLLKESNNFSLQLTNKNGNSILYVICMIAWPLLKLSFSVILRLKWSGWRRKWSKITLLSLVCMVLWIKKREIELWANSDKETQEFLSQLTFGVEVSMYNKSHLLSTTTYLQIVSSISTELVVQVVSEEKVSL